MFIEVKQQGKAEHGVRQALLYAFQSGVPFIVLTDGQTWSFYLPAEQGSYEERFVCKLDLFECPLDEATKTLSRYLACVRVESGEALEAARTEYRTRNRLSQARAAIPESWRELVEKGDEDLVEILANSVERKSGIRPDDNDVAEFLAGLGEPSFTAQGKVPRPAPGEPSRTGTLVLRSKEYHYANAKDAMVTVLSELAKGDPSFLERCSRHPDAQGSKRRYIARTPEELYPDRGDFREMCEPLPGGWLVATNLNNIKKKTILKLAAEVAGLRFGKDVTVEF